MTRDAQHDENTIVDRIREPVRRFVRAVAALWQHPTYAPSSFRRSSSEKVYTEGNEASRRLAKTRRLVRGSAGVRVYVSTGSLHESNATGPFDRVFDVLALAVHWPHDAIGGELAATEQELHQASAALSLALQGIPALWYRLFESRGYKHYEPYELKARLGAAEHNDDIMLGIARAFSGALNAHGFTWESRGTFSAWDGVSEHVVNAFIELAARTHHHYEAIAYLNGPLIDEPGSIELGRLRPSDPGSAIRIAYASDPQLELALSRHLVQEAFSDSVKRANTVITFSLSVPVDASVEAFLATYPHAAHIVSLVLDVLRIVHGGDIGVGAVRIAEVTPYTPTIRRTYAWEYEPDTMPFQARRLAFDVPPERVLQEEEIVAIRGLLQRHLSGLQQQGFDVAIGRFRDSYERYGPTDAMKLLDVAIAFEALLLSDSPQKELSHRLCVRGARWLEDALDTRRETFKQLKWLYELRSKIAHGASLSHRDEKRLAVVLEQSPVLLRRALQRALDGMGPVGLSGDHLRDWWQDLELG